MVLAYATLSDPVDLLWRGLVKVILRLADKLIKAQIPSLAAAAGSASPKSSTWSMPNGLQTSKSMVLIVV